MLYKLPCDYYIKNISSDLAKAINDRLFLVSCMSLNNHVNIFEFLRDFLVASVFKHDAVILLDFDWKRENSKV